MECKRSVFDNMDQDCNTVLQQRQMDGSGPLDRVHGVNVPERTYVLSKNATQDTGLMKYFSTYLISSSI